MAKRCSDRVMLGTCCSIPMKSKFDIKSIAGNIIPAIATTNAIGAGLQALQAIKILQDVDVTKECRYVWICRRPNRLGHHLCATELCRPNPSCFSCNRQTLCCHVDTYRMKLKDFFNNVSCNYCYSPLNTRASTSMHPNRFYVRD